MRRLQHHAQLESTQPAQAGATVALDGPCFYTLKGPVRGLKAMSIVAQHWRNSAECFCGSAPANGQDYLHEQLPA